MCTPRRPIRTARFALLGLALFAVTGSAFADDDPPDRVARLSFLQGDVSFQPSGGDDWTQANLNRPLGTGDKLYTDHDSRAEMDIGAATIRLDEGSTFDVLNLDDNVAQTELTEGVINLHVRHVFEGQSYEVDTPTLAFSITQPGDYRVDIAPDGNSTMVTVFNGSGDVYGENNASYSVRGGQTYRFNDSALRDYEVLDLPQPDDFDHWVTSRNARYDHAVSRKYVSEEVIGSADLDDAGGWSDVPEYGNVWYPNSVAADWAPYRDGHWSWVDPWGWTWVDNAAWGFAPFHYGRWVLADSRWGWCPGPIAVRPIYAPALVAFVGGAGWGIGVNTGPVGWFPLGPRDVYVPWYHASERYFTNVNVRNTRIVNNTYITNVYNNYSRGQPIANANYAYRQNASAVTAVSRDAFVGSRGVNAARVQINANQLRDTNVVSRVGIAPTRASFVSASAAHARVVPNAQLLDRRVIARTPPPPKAAPVATRIAAIQKNGAQPLAVTQMHQISSGAATGGGNAAVAGRGTLQRVQVVGQTGPKPQPIPLRAGNTLPAGTAQHTLPARGAVNTVNPNVHAPVTTQGAMTQGQTVQSKTGNGLPSSRFAPHSGQPSRSTGDTVTRTTNPNATLSNGKALPNGNGDPRALSHTTTTTTQQNNVQRSNALPRTRTGTPQTTEQDKVMTQGSNVQPRYVQPRTTTVQPATTIHQQEKVYTPKGPAGNEVRTAPPVRTLPQTVQHAPVVQNERRAPPPKEKKKDDDGGH